MTWDEWEQLKAAALARRQDQMRLNSAVAAGGGSSGAEPDLKTSKTEQKAAVKALEDVRRGTDQAGCQAEEASSAAVLEFSGWDTGSGLKDAHAEWELQVKNLKERLAKDQEDLEGAHRDFRYVDYGVRSRIAQIGAGSHSRPEV
jgi:uncharacterized protein (DUF1501 family)